MLLINWIPLTGQETIMVCGYVVIDFVCDVITCCAFVFVMILRAVSSPLKIFFFLACVVLNLLGNSLGNVCSEELEWYIITNVQTKRTVC